MREGSGVRGPPYPSPLTQLSSAVEVRVRGRYVDATSHDAGAGMTSLAAPAVTSRTDVRTIVGGGDRRRRVRLAIAHAGWPGRGRGAIAADPGGRHRVLLRAILLGAPAWRGRHRLGGADGATRLGGVHHRGHGGAAAGGPVPLDLGRDRRRERLLVRPGVVDGLVLPRVVGCLGAQPGGGPRAKRGERGNADGGAGRAAVRGPHRLRTGSVPRRRGGAGLRARPRRARTCGGRLAGQVTGESTRRLIRVIAWLLTPVVAWAASFSGGGLGAVIGGGGARPKTGLLWLGAGGP